jgi:hypothetical protein
VTTDPGQVGPQRPLHEMTTEELSRFRYQLERTLQRMTAEAPGRGQLQQRLTAIRAILQARARLTRLPARPRVRGLRRDAPAPRCRGVLMSGSLPYLASQDIRWRARSDGLCLWPNPAPSCSWITWSTILRFAVVPDLGAVYLPGLSGGACKTFKQLRTSALRPAALARLIREITAT